MDQPAIVENKVLSAALADMRQRQLEREDAKLAKRKRTLREEDLVRRSLGEEGLPERRPGRRAIRASTRARQAAEEVRPAGVGVVAQLEAQTVSRLVRP